MESDATDVKEPPGLHPVNVTVGHFGTTTEWKRYTNRCDIHSGTRIFFYVKRSFILTESVLSDVYLVIIKKTFGREPMLAFIISDVSLSRVYLNQSPCTSVTFPSNITVLHHITELNRKHLSNTWCDIILSVTYHF